jgi:hypothetical protein
MWHPGRGKTEGMGRDRMRERKENGGDKGEKEARRRYLCYIHAG